MKIAIDIDETIMDNASLIYKLANRLTLGGGKKKLGSKTISAESYESLEVGAISKISKLHNVRKWIEVDNCSEIIRDWFNQGVEILLLSSRPSVRNLNKVLLKWLELKSVPYSQIVLSCTNKAEFCKENDIEVLVDNSLQNCMAGKERGVYSVFFNKRKSSKLIDTADSWRKVNDFINCFIENKELHQPVLS